MYSKVSQGRALNVRPGLPESAHRQARLSGLTEQMTLRMLAISGVTGRFLGFKGEVQPDSSGLTGKMLGFNQEVPRV